MTRKIEPEDTDADELKAGELARRLFATPHRPLKTLSPRVKPPAAKEPKEGGGQQRDRPVNRPPRP
jgi:hypothetical protein